jgi:hypothetical protein
MQLYYMQKEGHKVSDSSVVLMTVAVIYKFVLVAIGVGILVLFHDPLAGYLGKYLSVLPGAVFKYGVGGIPTVYYDKPEMLQRHCRWRGKDSEGVPGAEILQGTDTEAGGDGGSVP